MSLWSFLGSIVGTVGKVIGVAASVFKVARPILEAIRPAIDEVDVALDWVEQNAAKVGAGADDFLDRNAQTIADLEAVSGRGVVVFGKLNELAVALRVASQEQTPDTITEDEAKRLVSLVGEIRDAIRGWRPELDAAIKSIKAAEADAEAIAAKALPSDEG